MKTIVWLLLIVAPALAVADKSLDKGTTWDCKKDPVVTIGTGAGKYVFKGACTRILLGGGQNKLDIESVATLDVGGGVNTIAVGTVDTLNVGGANNTITVGTVGTIDVGGAGNKITWKKAKDGDKPTLRGQPDKNTIAQGK
jgi:hypothetical protein